MDFSKLDTLASVAELIGGEDDRSGDTTKRGSRRRVPVTSKRSNGEAGGQSQRRLASLHAAEATAQEMRASPQIDMKSAVIMKHQANFSCSLPVELNAARLHVSMDVDVPEERDCAVFCESSPGGQDKYVCSKRSPLLQTGSSREANDSWTLPAAKRRTVASTVGLLAVYPDGQQQPTFPPPHRNIGKSNDGDYYHPQSPADKLRQLRNPGAPLPWPVCRTGAVANGGVAGFAPHRLRYAPCGRLSPGVSAASDEPNNSFAFLSRNHASTGSYPPLAPPPLPLAHTRDRAPMQPHSHQLIGTASVVATDQPDDAAAAASRPTAGAAAALAAAAPVSDPAMCLSLMARSPSKGGPELIEKMRIAEQLLSHREQLGPQWVRLVVRELASLCRSASVDDLVARLSGQHRRGQHGDQQDLEQQREAPQLPELKAAARAAAVVAAPEISRFSSAIAVGKAEGWGAAAVEGLDCGLQTSSGTGKLAWRARPADAVDTDEGAAGAAAAGPAAGAARDADERRGSTSSSSSSSRTATHGAEPRALPTTRSALSGPTAAAATAAATAIQPQASGPAAATPAAPGRAAAGPSRGSAAAVGVLCRVDAAADDAAPPTLLEPSPCQDLASKAAPRCAAPPPPPLPASVLTPRPPPPAAGPLSDNTAAAGPREPTAAATRGAQGPSGLRPVRLEGPLNPATLPRHLLERLHRPQMQLVLRQRQSTEEEPLLPPQYHNRSGSGSASGSGDDVAELGTWGELSLTEQLSRWPARSRHQANTVVGRGSGGGGSGYGLPAAAPAAAQQQLELEPLGGSVLWEAASCGNGGQQEPGLELGAGAGDGFGQNVTTAALVTAIAQRARTLAYLQSVDLVQQRQRQKQHQPLIGADGGSCFGPGRTAAAVAAAAAAPLPGAALAAATAAAVAMAGGPISDGLRRRQPPQVIGARFDDDDAAGCGGVMEWGRRPVLGARCDDDPAAPQHLLQSQAAFHIPESTAAQARRAFAVAAASKAAAAATGSAPGGGGSFAWCGEEAADEMMCQLPPPPLRPAATDVSQQPGLVHLQRNPSVGSAAAAMAAPHVRLGTGRLRDASRLGPSWSPAMGAAAARSLSAGVADVSRCSYGGSGGLPVSPDGYVTIRLSEPPLAAAAADKGLALMAYGMS